VKGKSLLEDSDARSAFDQVVDRLFLIEETWKTAVRDGRVENGCISYDESLLQFMDNTRNELIEIANGVFLRYGLAPLSKIRIPVERGLGNTTTHSRRSHLLSHRYESEPPRNPVKGEQTRVVPHIAPPYRSDSLDFFDVIVQQPRFIEQSKRKPEEKTMDGATEKEVKE
jgi:hypothetical protein